MKPPRATLFAVAILLCAQPCRGQVLTEWNKDSPAPTFKQSPATPRTDSHVVPAQAVEAPSAERDKRMLAPPSRSQIPAVGATNKNSRQRPNAVAMPNVESFKTAGAGLAIVVGLFFACMWLLRRSGPKPTDPLPKEAVAVLGRIPLAARNFAHLLQVGNKLVLVAITPDGASPITEITDPGEVQRMLGLCLRGQKHSTTAEFHNVLEQLAKEPAKGFLGNEATATYASQRR